MEKRAIRLSPAQALQRWGSRLRMRLPDGKIKYASFDEEGGFWYPVFDEDMNLVSYVLMEYRNAQ